MRLVDIYNLAVKSGIKNDPRSPARLKEVFSAVRREYRKLKGPDKACFDKERFANPYNDTRILFGDPNAEIKSIMVGIDMEGPELLLADRLVERGQKVDLVMSHHPEGRAWASFYDVMQIQVDMLIKLGVKKEIANELLKERIEEVERAVLPANHTRHVDVAKLLGIPYMCVHTVCDNMVTAYLQRLLDKKKPKTVGQVLGILKNIPEYKEAIKRNAGPKLIAGKEKAKPGRIFVDMTGGTEGSKRVFGRLSQLGVGTIISMHLSEEHFKNAKAEYVNLIIAGHIASDSVGINLFLDELEKREKIKIIPASGFMRIRRQ